MLAMRAREKRRKGGREKVSRLREWWIDRWRDEETVWRVEEEKRKDMRANEMEKKMEERKTKIEMDSG